MPADGIPLGDVLADSGYAHRDAAAWAIPLRQAGAQLIQDLHPHDRGPRGTHAGAIIANGSLYCPMTPGTLLELGPLPRDATSQDIAAHDARAAELARHKLGRITADDADGYHRVTCPAAAGKIRCPHRPESMKLDRGRPEILTPPEHTPACCTQQTITVPPRRRSQNPAETRLPIPRAPPLLRPAHQRRTHLLHHQGPRHHHHRPRLVPPDRPDATRALARLPARPSATSASSQPSTPARPTPPAAPQPGSRPRPGNAGARPSPASPPPRHRQTAKPSPPARRHLTSTSTSTSNGRHRGPARTRQRQPHSPAQQTGHTERHPARRPPAPSSQPRMSAPDVNMNPGEM